jgi:hypothetical protein
VSVIILAAGSLIAAPSASAKSSPAQVQHFVGCFDDGYCYDVWQMVKFAQPKPDLLAVRVITKATASYPKPECGSSSSVHTNSHVVSSVATGEAVRQQVTDRSTFTYTPCDGAPAQECSLDVIYRIVGGRLVRDSTKGECVPL